MPHGQRTPEGGPGAVRDAGEEVQQSKEAHQGLPAEVSEPGSTVTGGGSDYSDGISVYGKLDNSSEKLSLCTADRTRVCSRHFSWRSVVSIEVVKTCRTCRDLLFNRL